jgi:hypothetical protein
MTLSIERDGDTYRKPVPPRSYKPGLVEKEGGLSPPTPQSLLCPLPKQRSGYLHLLSHKFVLPS